MSKTEIVILMLLSDKVSAHKHTLPLEDKVNKLIAHTDLMHAKYVNVCFSYASKIVFHIWPLLCRNMNLPFFP